MQTPDTLYHLKKQALFTMIETNLMPIYSDEQWLYHVNLVLQHIRSSNYYHMFQRDYEIQCTFTFYFKLRRVDAKHAEYRNWLAAKIRDTFITEDQCLNENDINISF
jgi:hypothetical protein